MATEAGEYTVVTAVNDADGSSVETYDKAPAWVADASLAPTWPRAADHSHD